MSARTTFLTALWLTSLPALNVADATNPASAGQIGSLPLYQPHTREEWIAKFDAFNAAINHGLGFSQATTSSDVGWNEGYLLTSYLNMYQATQSQKYADSFVTHINQMIGPNGTWYDVNVAGKTYKGWTTDRYNAAHKQYPYVVNDGMICLPLARFVYLVRAGELPPIYAKAAGLCLGALENHLIGKWESCWREIPDSNPPQGVYVNLTDPDIKDAGDSLPNNQFLVMAEACTYLGRTKNFPLAAKYADRAAKMLQAFKCGLTIKNANGSEVLCWNYWNHRLLTDRIETHSGQEDTRHGNLDVSAMVTGYEMKVAQEGKPIFNEQDIQRLCNTFTQLMWRGDSATPSIANRVNGEVFKKPQDDSLAVNAWVRLGSYDPRVLENIRALYEARIFPSDRCGNTSYLQAISEIVLRSKR